MEFDGPHSFAHLHFSITVIPQTHFFSVILDLSVCVVDEGMNKCLITCRLASIWLVYYYLASIRVSSSS